MKKENIIGERYRLDEELGQGGSSKVYKCTHLKLGMECAIKVVDKSKSGRLDAANEAFVLRDLRHKNLPIVMDIFEDEKSVYIVREYCKGTTLRERVSAIGPLEYETLKKLAVEVSDVLSYLHAQDPVLIYRDLKPSNIIVSNDFDVKLIDFGISRRYDNKKEDDTLYIGSQKYAAPEQFGLEQSTIQTDIYSFGLLVYYMFNGEDYSDVPKSERWSKFVSTKEKTLQSAILKAISVNQKDRQANLLEFIETAFQDTNSAPVTEVLLENRRYSIERRQKQSIAFMGIKQGIGVSHIAINAAIAIQEKNLDCIYSNQSLTNAVERLNSFLDGEDPAITSELDSFRYKKCKMISNQSGSNIPQILSMDYEVAVFDFGAYHSRMGDFLRMQTKVFLIPSQPYALSQNLGLIKEILSYPDVKILMNLSHTNADEVFDWLAIPKNRRYSIGFIGEAELGAKELLLELCDIHRNENAYAIEFESARKKIKAGNRGLIGRIFG